MKIRCANCNNKAVSFFEGFKYRGNVVCANCKSHLRLESNRAYRPLAFLNIIFIIFIVVQTENGKLNSFLGYFIIFLVFLLTMFSTTISTISNHNLTKQEHKKIKKDNLLKFGIIISLFLYNHLYYILNYSYESTGMKILLIIVFAGPIYLAYTVIKNNKK